MKFGKIKKIEFVCTLALNGNSQYRTKCDCKIKPNSRSYKYENVFKVSKGLNMLMNGLLTDLKHCKRIR